MFAFRFREEIMGNINKFGALSLTALMAASSVSASDHGSFDGYTLRVKLIGGAQYEPLYTLIPQWEEATGASVDILSRKSHFELDREMKQDIAAGNTDYCVFSNHTNFAPQYEVMTEPLDAHIPADVIADQPRDRWWRTVLNAAPLRRVKHVLCEVAV